jgi:hypothetical protein
VALLVMGAGSLALLFFGWDVLLAVAVELAFSVTRPVWPWGWNVRAGSAPPCA